MDFDFSEEQRMLQDSVARLISDGYDFEQRKTYIGEAGGYSRKMWSSYADMGLLGLPFSEEDGGFGGGPVDTLIVMQSLGRAMALEPYLATVVLGGGLLRDAGTPAQRAAHLPAIASGETTVAFVHSETDARFNLARVETTARPEGKGWRLNGSKRFVISGDSAEWLIVSTRTAGAADSRDGISLFIVDAKSAGITRRGYTTQDHSRSADISFSDVLVGAENLIGTAGAALPLIERATDQAIAALCAEAVGVMERLHEITVDYLKLRKQFGVVIGSFQILQHRAVDMLVAIEQARSMALYATMMCSEPDAATRASAISAAKVQIGRSARLVGQEAIQLHGGIGMTEECQAGHFFRRLTVIETLFGDSAHHLKRVAQAGGLITA